MAPAGFGDRVEGLHAVTAAAAAGRVAQLWVEQGRLRRSEFQSVVEYVLASSGTVSEVDDVISLAETTAPQGLVARCVPRHETSLDELTTGAGPAAVMVLDHVVDPHNLGAIARSVAAAGLSGLVLPSRRAAPLSAAAFKAAAGALETVAVTRVSSIAEALGRLRRLGLWSIGLDQEAEQVLWGLPLLSEPVALVVGDEGTGLSRLVAERVEVRVRIPIAPSVESLNASVAAALAAFEVSRVRGL
ncbi:MAG TPA: RNA methyltransferase [Acidimicrobiia bacterium]|jgi:23S rRNA (guanosine2251-2'-O)-methyltransferase